MANWDDDQRKIDDIFAQALTGRFVPPLERTLRAAKRGAADPDALSEDEVRLVCETLLIQYAQMGIS